MEDNSNKNKYTDFINKTKDKFDKGEQESTKENEISKEIEKAKEQENHLSDDSSEENFKKVNFCIFLY